jgi:DNA-binding NarL/FixJ family response regulator
MPATHAVQARHPGGPSGRHPSRTARGWPATPSPGQAGLELVGLVVGEAELRALVERSRPGPTANLRALPSAWPSRLAQTAERPTEPGLLVLSPRGHAQHALERLTDREREVLALMAEGRSNSAIATRLFITEHTVEKHVKNIFASLRLAPSTEDHRRVLAVLAYLEASRPPAGP